MYNLYYLKSTLDDKMYIGITKTPEKRYQDHLTQTIKKKHHNGNWIRKTIKNGGEIKMIIILESMNKETAIEMEIKMIDFFRGLYKKRLTNTADGGLGFDHTGIPHSEEHKKNLEKAQPHKIRIPKKILYDLYVNQKLSKKKIGEIYNCGSTTIDRRLKEYDIPIRTTPNYKVSYELNRDEVLKMYLDDRMTIRKISEKLGIGMSGVRFFLQRENIPTDLNNHKHKCDKKKLKQRYDQLIESKIKKMKIYDILSDEFNLTSSYISHII